MSNTSIMIKERQLKELDRLKQYENEPYWRVLERLINSGGGSML